MRQETIKRKSQSDRLLELLITAHGAPVFLPQILELRISQYGARIRELRDRGFQIENEREWRDGKWCTAFRLVRSGPLILPSTPAPTKDLETATLFDIGKPMRWVDPEER
jgi:Helix-turn-helix domain